ncbi:MAG: hypothetical protein Q8J68_08395 [Methanolobus sp.]|uniref:hypothetical protein n=1 Tax=Methanolobus sp. TaxID=1874737 RepID=UPI00272F28F8|nr:hypothetical protein [Methanolobus sp.]MDP2217290.1 hypothetical protein [Methanolobus sp.]
MDKRLLIIPVILVIGFAIMLSGVLNISNDDVPAEAEDIIITEEPETIFQSTDINDSEMNETLEEAPSTPNMGGMGGMGGGLPPATPITTTPATDTDDETEESTASTTTYTFYIKVAE